jgi:hypothetical protein
MALSGIWKLIFQLPASQDFRMPGWKASDQWFENTPYRLKSIDMYRTEVIAYIWTYCPFCLQGIHRNNNLR